MRNIKLFVEVHPACSSLIHLTGVSFIFKTCMHWWLIYKCKPIGPYLLASESSQKCILEFFFGYLFYVDTNIWWSDSDLNIRSCLERKFWYYKKRKCIFSFIKGKMCHEYCSHKSTKCYAWMIMSVLWYWG